MNIQKNLGEKKGGYGSGRQRERGLVTEYRFLNIRWLSKKGYLESQGEKLVYWQRNGKPWGNIKIYIEDSSIRLIYKESTNDGPWKEKDLWIQFTKTPCRYGGFQYWFVCPVCRRKAVNLYLVSNWLCRQCGHLAYPTENEDDLGRLQSKARKLKDKLGEEYWFKPKGMHQKTYDNLRTAYLEAEEKVQIAFDEKLSEFSKRLPFRKNSEL